MNPFRLPHLMIVMLFLLFAGSLLAQSSSKLQDVLYLKNGWVIRGWVLSDVITDSLRIETVGGNIFVFAKEDIRARKEEAFVRRKGGRKPYVPSPVKNGYYGYLRAGLMAGSESNGSSSNQSLDLMMGHGYRFHHWMGLGGGVGITFLPQGVVMPVFVEARSLMRKVGTGFYGYAKGGYSFPLYQHTIQDWWGMSEARVSGGVVGETGIGVRIPTPRNMAWMIGIGYRVQQNKERFLFEWEETVERTVSYRRIMVSLGIEL